MPKQPLGVTFNVPAGQEATGVYEAESGIEAFETDSPYLLSDGVSLQPPLPVMLADGSTFIDSMGNVQAALAVSGIGPGPDPVLPGEINDLSVLSTTTSTAALAFTDAENATSHQYRLDGGAAATLASNKIVTGLDPDTTYDVEVRGRNSAGSGEWSNVAEIVTQEIPDTTAPTITSDNPSGSYEEGVSIGGTLTADEAVTWSKSGTDADAVTLNASTGVWSLEETDYETKQSYSWTFTATDAAENSTNQVVAITITEAVIDPYDDPDLNKAYAFQQYVLSYDQGSGDRAEQLFDSFDDLKAYLNVGLKADPNTLTPGSDHPSWNAGANRLDLPANGTLDGYDVQGQVYQGAGVSGNGTITNCRIRSTDGIPASITRIHKQSNDALYEIVVEDCDILDGQACGGALVSLTRCFQNLSSNDNFKMGHTGGPGRRQRFENVWGQACGIGVGSHGDGWQSSTGSDVTIVSSVVYSGEEGTPYSTGAGAGQLTNAFRIDASNTTRLCERFLLAGMLSCFGGINPMGILAQDTRSITRNITIAHNVFAPASFRGKGADENQLHQQFTDLMNNLYVGSGLLENVGFFGNEIFGVGPVLYNDRGSGAVDITGIWHWNKATLDEDTAALWRDLGLLDANDDPMPGMLRSVAGTIETQPKTVTATAGGALNLDLSDIPDGTTIKLHLPGTFMELEYIAGGA